ncbi:hypothetical protein J437_LFUL013249 [Ladona fulva]|uniref:Uncharacterized protein n=1 Tax=Ladona fulva TaxID=123851 RepID=A0A8K0KFR8_LADFU|nr:hypothetical protein J437_LFUL013249 [Ladona fulva]
MGGVDTADQMLSYYNFKRKTLSWYTRLGFRIIAKQLISVICTKNIYTSATDITARYIQTYN